MKLKILLAFHIMLVLTGCDLGPSDKPVQMIDKPRGDAPLANRTEQKLSYEPQALSALFDFYDSLNQGAYEKAASLYGGTYDTLQYFNPEIDPMDNISLLQAGCEFNGIMCLQVLKATLMEENNPIEFVYEVSFSNQNGSLFVLGPCCGATEEEMPPVSEFTVKVICESKKNCFVLDLPPFVP